jgi:hypothetical protein
LAASLVSWLGQAHRATALNENFFCNGKQVQPFVFSVSINGKMNLQQQAGSSWQHFYLQEFF